jgi:hypothetical protein
VNLSDVDEDIGHTLVHFLYTGTYQTLKPSLVRNGHVSNGHVSDEVLEYKRSLQVCMVARTYGLVGLEHHARETMQRYGFELSLTDMVAVLQDIDFEREDGGEGQTWPMTHLQEKLRAEFAKDEDVFVSEGFLRNLGNRPALTRLLIKLMDGIYKEKIDQVKEQVRYMPEQGNSAEANV